MWQDLRFEYDPFGNLATKLRGANQTQRFTYDGQDRLITVRTQDARGVVETRFEYDSLGRRLVKTDTSFDVRGMKQRTETKRFVWEGLRLAQEIRETGVSSYVYSPDAPYTPAARVDAVIAEALAAVAIDTAKRAARIYHFHTDLVGAPLEVTDESGELAWAGKYSAWGKVEPSARQLTAARTDQPLRYAGQYADDSTGLHYNTFRFYDPDVGRFINQDPIGLLGGDNLYQYAPNPVRWLDPWGLAVGDYGQMPSYRGWQLHHNIPQNLADHPVIIESGYDVNTSRNITRLPTSSSVDPTRTVHRGMHTQAYNDMVESGLDRIHASNASPEIKAMQIQALSDNIGEKLRTKQIRLNKAC